MKEQTSNRLMEIVFVETNSLLDTGYYKRTKRSIKRNLIELIKYGYVFSNDVSQKLDLGIISEDNLAYSLDWFVQRLESSSREKDDALVIYDNFATRVPEMDEMEYRIDQLLHYLVGYIPPQQDIEQKDSTETINFKTLDVLNMSDIPSILKKKLLKNISLSEWDRNVIDCLVPLYPAEAVSIFNDIPMKETQTLVLRLLKRVGYNEGLKLSTATDVLRFIAEESDSRINKKFIQYGDFNSIDIDYFLSLLDKVNDAYDDMHRYRKPWKKFFIYFKDLIDYNKYNTIQEKADRLFQRKELGRETAIGKVNRLYSQYIKNPSIETLAPMITAYKERPGHFARQLISILAIEPRYTVFILESFADVMDEVSARVIVQIINRLLTNTERIVELPHGSVYHIPKSTNIDKLNIDLIVYFLKANLYSRWSNERPLEIGELANRAVTTSNRNVSKMNQPLTRYTTMKLSSEHEVLRFFTAWRDETKSDTNSYIDIDLSLLALNDSYETVDTVSYFSSFKLLNSNDETIMYHSGDVTYVKPGQTSMEYIDVLTKVSHDDIRYLIIVLNSYSMNMFSELDVESGVMGYTLEEAKNSKNYNENRVVVKSDHQTDSTGIISYIYDTKTHELTWVDMSMNFHRSYGANISHIPREVIINVMESKDKVLKYQDLVEAFGNPTLDPIQVDNIDELNNILLN